MPISLARATPRNRRVRRVHESAANRDNRWTVTSGPAGAGAPERAVTAGAPERLVEARRRPAPTAGRAPAPRPPRARDGDHAVALARSGVALARERRAGGLRPRPLDLREQRRGREPVGQRARARAPTGRGRGAAAPHARLRLPGLQHAPSAIASARDAGLLGARARARGRSSVITLWPPARRTSTSRSRRPASSSLITSSSSISGGAPRSSASTSRSASSSASSAEPLLAARAVGAQLAPVAAEREVVAVRAVAGEAALEVGRRRARRARPPARPRSSPSSAAGSASSGSPSRPSARACAANRGRRRSTTAGAVAPSARCRGGRARRPRPAASRGRRGRRGSRATSALRWASAAAYARRVPARAGHSAATTWSRCARRSAGAPEHELEPVGQEHRDQRPRRARRSAARRARRRRAAASPRRAGSRPRARAAAVVVLAPQLQPRHAARRSARLALVGGPARAAGAGEVERLEQVRLAGAVAAGDHGQPGPEPHLRRLVGAEVAQAEPGGDARPAALYTFSRIGISRYMEPAAVRRLDQARAAAARSA